MTAFATVLVDGHPFHIPGPGPLPTMDPVDVEALPPVDLDACEHCTGLGAIITGLDEAEQPIDQPCAWCDGSGDRRGWTGAA